MVEVHRRRGGCQRAWGAGYQSYWTHDLDKALAGNDIAHRFIASSVYELPVGKGKALSVSNSFLNAVVGGWSLGGIVELRGGAPYAVTEQTNRLNSISSSQRSDQLRSADLPADRPRSELVRQWFDTAAFAFPGAGVLGNASRSPGRGPGVRERRALSTEELALPGARRTAASGRVLQPTEPTEFRPAKRSARQSGVWTDQQHGRRRPGGSIGTEADILTRMTRREWIAGTAAAALPATAPGGYRVVQSGGR